LGISQVTVKLSYGLSGVPQAEGGLTFCRVAFYLLLQIGYGSRNLPASLARGSGQFCDVMAWR
jgi:hypothetical protein